MKLPKVSVRKHDKNSKIYWKPYINTRLWGGEIWVVWILKYTIEFDWRDGFKITDLLVNDEEKKSFWKRMGIWDKRN